MRETLRLLANSTPDTISLDDVAKNAKISRGSIFWHFKSKEGLLLACMDLIFQDFVEKLQIDFQNCKTRKEKLRIFLGKYADFCVKRPEINVIILSFLLQKRDNKKMRKKIQELFGKFRQYVLVNLSLPDNEGNRDLITVFIGALDGIFLQWLIQPEVVRIKESYLLLERFFDD